MIPPVVGTDNDKRYKTAREVRKQPIITEKDLDNDEMVSQSIKKLISKHDAVLRSLAEL